MRNIFDECNFHLLELLEDNIIKLRNNIKKLRNTYKVSR